MIEMTVEYRGDHIEGPAHDQVKAVVWASLRKQAYAPGTIARVMVHRHESSYRIEAMAKEPKGPPLRLVDLELPHAGADEGAFARFLQSEGLAPYVDAPAGATMVGLVQRTSPKVGRNDPCPCGSGKKAKRCCSA